MNRPSPLRLVLVGCVLVGAGASVVAPSSIAGAPKKQFHVLLTGTYGATTVGPATTVPLPANTTVALTFALQNASASSAPFGSARIAPPPGITLDSVTTPPDGYPNFSVSISSGTLLVTSTGPTGTGVAPGSTLTINAQADVGAGACPPTWSVQVKQSNDFSGPPGNAFSTSDVISTPTGDNKLVYTTPPSVTEWDVAMSPAPVVGAVDACGNPIALTGSVNISDTKSQIDAGGGDVTAGTNGTVTVSGLTFLGFGFFDQLVAMKDGFDTATSSEFTVAQVKETCTSTSSCPKLTIPGTDTSATVTIGSGTKGDPVSGSVTPPGDVPAACQEPTDPTAPQIGDTVTVDTPRGKTVTVIIPKAVVESDPNNGAPFYDVCLVIPPEQQTLDNSNTFTDKAGNQGVYVGLLPDCASKTDTGPCIVSRQKKNGDEYIIFNLPPGDPHGLVL